MMIIALPILNEKTKQIYVKNFTSTVIVINCSNRLLKIIEKHIQDTSKCASNTSCIRCDTSIFHIGHRMCHFYGTNNVLIYTISCVVTRQRSGRSGTIIKSRCVMLWKVRFGSTFPHSTRQNATVTSSINRSIYWLWICGLLLTSHTFIIIARDEHSEKRRTNTNCVQTTIELVACECVSVLLCVYVIVSVCDAGKLNSQ